MNNQSTTASAAPPEPPEEYRRRQLVEVTIDSLAELGYVGTTLAQIAGRAGVSPGLVAHYFGDKDGLLYAAFRSLAKRVGDQVRTRLRLISTPRARIQAVIDANLSQDEFSQRTGSAWLAFWGQVLQVASLKRVQSVYQRRTLTNLRCSLRQIVPPDEAHRLSTMIAAMIDGVWLRAALSGWREADSESARALLTEFVDGRLRAAADAAKAQGPGITARVKAGTSGEPTPGPGERFASVNPATGEVLGHFTVAGPSHLDAAVRAAERGQKIWSAMSGAARARVLNRAAQIISTRKRELAELETRDTGKPIQETLAVDVVAAAACLEYFAVAAQVASAEHREPGPAGFGYTRREPLGVVAAIGAWKHPLQLACSKAAPALAGGNAMIFKPAQLTPFTAVALEQILEEAGLPPGVFQVVQGFADTARMLARHPRIRLVSLYDEADSGNPGLADAAPHAPRGKSPLIVFDDANLDDAVSGSLPAILHSNGQAYPDATCVFVQASVRAAFLGRMVRRVGALRIGDPMDPRTQVGPLVSEPHMHTVLAQVERGRAEGARLLIGGNRITTGGLQRGYFVAPALFDDCRDDMSIVRAQIFGPVMSVLEFEDERAVVERANATGFGRSASVFTNDLSRAQRMIAQLQVATCWIHCGGAMPVGGVIAPELGLAGGRAAIEHYTRLKSAYVATGDIDARY